MLRDACPATHHAHTSETRSQRALRLRQWTQVQDLLSPEAGSQPELQMSTSPPDLARNEEFLRLPSVKAMTGLSKASVYRMGQAGTFPRSITISPRYAIWRKSEVLAWMSQQVARCCAASSRPQRNDLATPA